MSLKKFSEKELAQYYAGEMVIKFENGEPVGYFSGGTLLGDSQQGGGITKMSQKSFDDFYNDYLKEIAQEGFPDEQPQREETPRMKREREAQEESLRYQEKLDRESEEQKLEERMKRFEKYVQDALKEE